MRTAVLWVLLFTGCATVPEDPSLPWTVLKIAKGRVSIEMPRDYTVESGEVKVPDGGRLITYENYGKDLGNRWFCVNLTEFPEPLKEDKIKFAPSKFVGTAKEVYRRPIRFGSIRGQEAMAMLWIEGEVHLAICRQFFFDRYLLTAVAACPQARFHDPDFQRFHNSLRILRVKDKPVKEKK
ncbi:MAG: hypothetical protein ACYTHM_00630 [Planctomycetota bacterium]|jgi:hypothetical protein